MALKIYRKIAGYDPKAFEFFDFEKLDAFHQPEILSVIYGDNWESVLIVDGNKAFLHAFSKKKIGNYEWYDVEPFVGYAGPISNTDYEDFNDKAIKKYSQLCHEENIIAELIRFNPLIQNHKKFQKNSLLEIVPTKEIVIANCYKDKSIQLKEINANIRRNIANYALNVYSIETSYSAEKKENFSILYYQFLDNIKAKPEWYFPQSLFSRAARSPSFKLVEVSNSNGLPCSTSLIIDHNLASYYFLSTNRIPRCKGANEMMLFKICLDAAEKGINKLILGGGNTSSAKDSLLIYKKKFAPEAKLFFIGKMVHSKDKFETLCQENISRKPEIKNLNFFLKYRL